ncbi:MAG: hypothetical protein ABSG41_11015 [Bryobacteraceae bacterium]|jgi:hypothetical protein
MSWHSVAGEVAQCVMCYRTAAAQQAERSRVLNSGIVILLIPPILVLGLILLLAFRKNRAATPIAAADLSDSKR